MVEFSIWDILRNLLLATRWTNEEGDIGASLRQAPAKVATDAAGAEHQNLQIRHAGNRSPGSPADTNRRRGWVRSVSRALVVKVHPDKACLSLTRVVDALGLLTHSRCQRIRASASEGTL